MAHLEMSRKQSRIYNLFCIDTAIKSVSEV